MLNFKFNPKDTQKSDPGAFTGECELWNCTYTKSRKGFPMVQYTWKYQGTLFNDYHSCCNESRKEEEAQFLGKIFWSLNEDPQQVVDEMKPESIGELIADMCEVINTQLRFKVFINRSKREANSNFYDVELQFDKGLKRVEAEKAQ